MRLFMTVILALVLVVPSFATDYAITSGYYGTVTYQNWDTLIMTGGGINSLTAEDYSSLDIRNTSSLAAGSGGIWQLILTENSQLVFSGGQLRGLNIFGSATATISGGRIDRIYNYQSTTTPNYMQHIEMIVKDYVVASNILTGRWADNSTFNIQLMNQSGYDPVIDNIKFTIIPEPATLLLLTFGGLMLKRK